MKVFLQHNIYSAGNAIDSYCVAKFLVADPPPFSFTSPDGCAVQYFTGTGYGFPTIRKNDSTPIILEVEGEWVNKPKHGWQFAISSFWEVIPPTKEGLKEYMARSIRGIGPATANAIYKKFGAETPDILDNHPERLTEVKGISPRKAKLIGEQVYATRRARDVICYLAPFKISVRTCNLIVQHYEGNAMRIIRERPYELTSYHGFGFKVCDKIAAANGLAPNDPERLKAALVYVLLSNEQSEGHLCMLTNDWLNKAADLLRSLPFPTSSGGVEYQQIIDAASSLQQEQQVFFSSIKNGESGKPSIVYRRAALKAEVETTRRLTALRTAECTPMAIDALTKCIRAAELQCSATLSDEQREAVISCINNNVTVLTGGPGTGKTTMLRVALTVYSMLNQGKTVTLCAPTGKAARRMSESTGYAATTIHRAIGITDIDDEECILETNFVVIDEFSMVDIFIAAKLFNSLKDGTKVLIVGDVDQLPSVGPGAVLSELISSGCLPCVRLTKVFRQKGASRVIVNAAHIRTGDENLEYGDDFVFVETNDQDEAAAAIVNAYLSELSSGVHMDDIMILSPRREQLPASAYALAEKIQACVNPASPDKPQVERFSCIYRLGDRVIQLKNTSIVNNGDIGTIVSISSGETNDAPMLLVDFGEDRQVEYSIEDLDNLRLAYACTIHKSQGSEYSVVIMSLSSSYGRMLQRNLVYTGITRAKRKVVIVGDKRALSTAIKTVNSNTRRTLLAYRLRESINKL